VIELRRIAAKYAKPGMVLGRPVYDSRGHMIFDMKTRLSEECLKTLSVYGVGELLIEDPRVADVVVQPLVPSELEAEAGQALRQLIAESQDSGSIEPMLIEQVKKPVFSMTRTLFPDVIGEPNAAGCLNLQEYSYVQPAKVVGLSLLMGRRLGYSMMQLAPLGVAALLMNVGYVKLPHVVLQPSILDKPSALTEAEFAEVKKHSQCGYELLSESGKVTPEVSQAVLQHHERWDGSGYPNGLKGEEITVFARIIAITDTYYALVSRRPHRREFLPHEAIEFIMAYGGELFDPELVQLFSKEVPLYPTGVTVKLNSGEVGFITQPNLGFIGRPVVRVVYDEEAQPIKEPFDVDLKVAENQKKLIVEVLAY
jgi:HD-GYP domain-containing protein (c-di-GMP phosphodiesterase class II)